MNQDKATTAVNKEPVMKPCKAIPRANEGVDVINLFLKRLPELLRFTSDNDRQKSLFLSLYGEETGEHLRDKFNTSRDFGGWFLNLSYLNQIRILQHMGIYIPEFPVIENWEAIKEEHISLQADAADWTMEDVREVCALEGSKDWNLYPHALIFINKFCLFANNNSISTAPFEEVAAEMETYALVQRINQYKNSKASCFGVLANWSNLWTSFLNSQEHQQLIEFLKSY